MGTPYVVPALTKHTATVIMAHGLGDTGAGWMSLAQNWRRRSKFDEVAFIFPNAPVIPITVNYGMRTPGWFDIAYLGRELLSKEEMVRTQDEPGILRSRDYFNTLIMGEIEKGIQPSRIVLGGFSQGGAVSLFTAITNEQKLAGVFGLSCFLPISDRIKQHMYSDPWPNRRTPFFIAHGTADSVVPYEFGAMSQGFLEELGAEAVDFHSYPGLSHSAEPEEIADLEKFLEKTIPPEEKGGEAPPGS